MSNHKLIVVDGVLIGRNYWYVPVRVDLRATCVSAVGWTLSYAGWLSAGRRGIPNARGVPATRTDSTPVPPIS